jgi:hypothetical protein
VRPEGTLAEFSERLGEALGERKPARLVLDVRHNNGGSSRWLGPLMETPTNYERSSSPNFVGEENEVVLPWSGATGSITDRDHVTIPGDTRVAIEPDIPLELSSADYFANSDPLLELVLARPTAARR